MGDLGQTLQGIFGGGGNPADMLPGMISGFGGGTFDIGSDGRMVQKTPFSQADISNQIANAYPTDVVPQANMPIPQEEAISVKGWKPKKQSILGILADAYLQSQGMKPAYKIERDRRNMQSAMEGFTQEPLEAIRRMAQIPGMEEKAWTLYNQVIDNQRADGTLARQNRALDMRNDDYIYQQTAGMMGAARPDTWQKMRELAIQRAQSRGVDVSSFIPEEYDADAIEYIRYGAVKPKDQMTLKERRENNQARVGIQRDRLSETQRHNQVSEGQAAANEAGRNKRHNTPKPSADPKKAAPQVMDIRDSAGNVRRVVVKGNIGVSRLPDGRQINYIVQNGKLIPVAVKKPGEK